MRVGNALKTAGSKRSLPGNRLRLGRKRGASTGDGPLRTSVATQDLRLGSPRNLGLRMKWFPTSKCVEKHVAYQRTTRPNQTMKPTGPLRYNFIVFVTTPCRGLSLSR